MTLHGIAGLAALALAVCVQPALAQKILLSPSSIIFEGRVNGAQLLVANTGDRAAVYRVEPAFFRMEKDGRLTEVRKPWPASSALDLVRFSPRQFELRPGESQFVRIATRLPATLTRGEYRIHLRIINVEEAQPRPQVSGSAATDAASAAEVNIQVTRAVRILVRKQASAGKAVLEGLKVEKSGNGNVEVKFDLRRTGEGSSQGEYFITARNGAASQVLLHGGALVYSDVASRGVTNAFPSAELHGKVAICVLYQDKAAVGAADGKEHCVDIPAL
jgi:P pilus assembly chaperone PapD